ncbi:nucleopolyhedrovirus P10 family protein [Streptomyces apocyni]|uniref:nucleopolyhedrovirus P10 family protein n=1 Tax=Streptomyces apocyni TaxID=2654677 RepID=UPI0012EA6635|nr:nucleopolyhedrovirus P10 family protein [Streptomyces apocyni]
MTADGWAQAVRDQLGLGRLLALGGASDGAWITERAAAGVLRGAAADTSGVRVERLRLALADPADVAEPAVPPPPSALPPGPLRVSAEFAATSGEPLRVAADRLRAALAEAAEVRLGLLVGVVDLRVTGLLDGAASDADPAGRDDAPSPPGETDPTAAAAALVGEGDEARAATAAEAAAGVARLTGALGGLGRAVHITGRAAPRGAAAVPGRHVRIELAVVSGHRAVDVARAVRRSVTDAFADHPTVSVLVTAVDRSS